LEGGNSESAEPEVGLNSRELSAELRHDLFHAARCKREYKRTGDLDYSRGYDNYLRQVLKRVAAWGHPLAAATHGAMLGMHAEMRRLGELIRQLLRENGPVEEITEDTIRLILLAYDSGDLARVKQHHTTRIGWQVLEWLATQSWFGKKSFPIILEKKSSGNRFELVCLFKEPDGTEKVSLILFLEDGAMKFHDVFLFDLKGDVYEMFLSEFVIHPIWARIKYGWIRIKRSLLGG
jgi:hypothetical protein